MSILTNFLKLFKYDPTTDGDNTFNIDTALNQNWDKVDAETQRLNIEIAEVKTSLGNISTTWDGITGKPTVFPPSTHGHDWTAITSKPTTFTPAAHTHDDRYYTETEITTILNDRGIGSLAREYDSGNLNSLSGYCIVKGANMINAPDADWWYVEQYVHAQGTWQYQKATALNRSLAGYKERWLNNGTWTAWTQVGGDVTVIKSIQRGVVTTTGTTYFMNITFNAVDLSKTTINLVGGGFGYPSGSDTMHGVGIFYTNLTNTGLQIQTIYSVTSGFKASWEVIEFM